MYGPYVSLRVSIGPRDCLWSVTANGSFWPLFFIRDPDCYNRKGSRMGKPRRGSRYMSQGTDVAINLFILSNTKQGLSDFWMKASCWSLALRRKLSTNVPTYTSSVVRSYSDAWISASVCAATGDGMVPWCSQCYAPSSTCVCQSDRIKSKHPPVLGQAAPFTKHIPPVAAALIVALSRFVCLQSLLCL